MDDDLLSEAQIDSLAIRVADGSATRDEAEKLLADFVNRCDRKIQISEMLLQHLADCLRSFLIGHRVLVAAANYKPRPFVKIDTLDKAFGISRPFKGAPTIDIDIYKEVAMQVLEKRIAGQTLEVASEELANERWSATLPVSTGSHIRDAWARYKMDGYVLLRASKGENASLWFATEQAKLGEIFAKEPWWPLIATE